MEKFKKYILLHLALLIYSISTIFSKIAASTEPFSFKMVLYIFLLCLFLGIYAFLWQQSLKRIELTVAYANKGITVLWGLLISAIVFKDKINIHNIIGCILIIIGVIIISCGKINNE